MSAWRLLPAPLLLAATVACGGPEGTREQYRFYCASCHGADGSGVPRLRGLYPNVDLTRSELVASRARGSLFRVIAGGYGTMPSFERQLDTREMQDLVAYVIELAETANTRQPPSDPGEE